MSLERKLTKLCCFYLSLFNQSFYIKQVLFKNPAFSEGQMENFIIHSFFLALVISTGKYNVYFPPHASSLNI